MGDGGGVRKGWRGAKPSSEASDGTQKCFDETRNSDLTPLLRICVCAILVSTVAHGCGHFRSLEDINLGEVNLFNPAVLVLSFP